MKFAPLHITTGYSFLQSGLTIEKISKSVQTNGYFSFAITDKDVMYGIPEYVHKMKDLKLPYIVGMEITLFNNNVCLYALNEEGYINLIHISSLISKEEFHDEDFDKYKEGLLAILDTNQGEFKERFNAVLESEDSFGHYLNDFSKLFEEFYLGIELKDREELTYVRKLRKFAKEHEYQTVAFPHILYQKEEDAIVLDIVEAIRTDQQIEIKEKTGHQFFYKEADYQRIYTPQELQNSIEIVKKSQFDYFQKRGEMLHFSSQADKDLEKLCFDKLEELGLKDNEVYFNRLRYELDVIIALDYPNYFLLVKDYVDYSRSQDILVGLRGSAAGSLVAYLLGISVLDPIEHNLQFERFLNPSRKTMPDIDIDFMDIRRNDVIEYCRQKYGQDHVSNIVTYQTILAKQALRDIGRIYNYPTRHIDLLSKRLTDQKLSLRESYKRLPAFKEIVDSDKYFLEIVSLAAKIEGLPRQAGMHAAGVILNNDSIDNHLPVSYDFSNNLISQYEMNYLEEQGFLKMDFLGLNHLTIVSNCVELINKNHPEAHLDKFNLPYRDEEAIKTISSLHTMGIFQLESKGMKNAIKTLKPSSYEDVAALLALFRPGPMKSIPTFARRKQGKEKVPHMDERIEKILGSTYGIITYQEQITELAVSMANMSVSEADNFRRAVSKKKASLLSSMEKSFIEGSIKNGYSKEEANSYYKRIEPFAVYGFNKSHAYGYALLSCQMAYLKAHYPLEFYSVILDNSSSTSDSKFNEYISEIKQRNIKLLAPDINRSGLGFELCENTLLFPLTSIKGINRIAVESILKERGENGEFKDFFDFVSRMYRYKLNEANITKLIDAGALDAFSDNRASMTESIKFALQYAELNYSEDGQMSFGIEITKPRLVEAFEDKLERLDKEYEAIGIMLSDSPLNYKKDILQSKNVTSIPESREVELKSEVKVAGIIKTKKTINTKKGTPMAFITIFDETGELEITVFPNLYQDCLSFLNKKEIIVVTGHYEGTEEDRDFIATKIERLED